jgi:broad specificity polyphosphatase/5'/3'-nucleotidase SurE
VVLVISGINEGMILGDDAYISGTVGAVLPGLCILPLLDCIMNSPAYHIAFHLLMALDLP